MKALNRKEVFISYLNFTKYMILLVILSLACVFVFFKTATTEITKIQSLGRENQRIFDAQIALSDNFDDFLQTYQSLDLVQESNTPFLMNNISTKKLNIETSLQKVPQKDVEIHKHIVSQMDKFLKTRDSIRTIFLWRSGRRGTKGGFVVTNGTVNEGGLRQAPPGAAGPTRRKCWSRAGCPGSRDGAPLRP